MVALVHPLLAEPEVAARMRMSIALAALEEASAGMSVPQPSAVPRAAVVTGAPTEAEAVAPVSLTWTHRSLAGRAQGVVRAASALLERHRAEDQVEQTVAMGLVDLDD